jgi:hypothetical protein
VFDSQADTGQDTQALGACRGLQLSRFNGTNPTRDHALFRAANLLTIQWADFFGSPKISEEPLLVNTPNAQPQTNT